MGETRLKGATRVLAAGTVMVIFAIASLGADGCAGDEKADPTPVQVFKITPAPNATGVAPQTAIPATPTEPAPPPPVGRPIIIAGINSAFDVEEVSAPPGSVTVEFDNRDGGVIHNIHFYRGSDNDGESVAESELESGPIKQTVVFEAEPGAYYYVCDAHPTTMEGTLTVE